MRITEHIWVVASGSAGFGLTNPYDCTVYLVDCEEGFVLIDAGAGLESGRILDEIRRAGFSPEDCLGILLTHAHADHAGGAAELAGATGAEVYASAPAAGYLVAGNGAAVALPAAIAAGVYPADYRLRPCPVAVLPAGEERRFGQVTFQAVDTSGHCSGHVAYLAELDGKKLLFSGDCVYPGGAISLQPIWDCSVPDYVAAIDRLALLEFNALLPSHHGLLLSGGRETVLEAKGYFDKLMMPRG